MENQEESLHEKFRKLHDILEIKSKLEHAKEEMSKCGGTEVISQRLADHFGSIYRISNRLSMEGKNVVYDPMSGVEEINGILCSTVCIAMEIDGQEHFMRMTKPLNEDIAELVRRNKEFAKILNK